jgi:hypothetical protein
VGRGPSRSFGPRGRAASSSRVQCVGAAAAGAPTAHHGKGAHGIRAKNAKNAGATLVRRDLGRSMATGCGAWERLRPVCLSYH